MSIIHLFGVPFAGWIFDITGSYEPAFITFLILYLLTALIVYGLRVETRTIYRTASEINRQLSWIPPATVSAIPVIFLAVAKYMTAAAISSVV